MIHIQYTLIKHIACVRNVWVLLNTSKQRQHGEEKED